MFCVIIKDQFDEIVEVHGPYENTNQCLARVDKMSADDNVNITWSFKIFRMLK